MIFKHDVEPGAHEDMKTRDEKQEPIVAGTPLDELRPATEGPLSGQALLSLQSIKPEERRQESGNILKPSVPMIAEPLNEEEEEEAVQAGSEMETSQLGSGRARRGFPGAAHEMGSFDLVFHPLISLPASRVRARSLFL